MRNALSGLHAVLQSIILDPTDGRLYERVDIYCFVIWEYCLEHGVTPWGWCLDRFCSCKVALSEHEPDPLPLPWKEMGY